MRLSDERGFGLLASVLAMFTLALLAAVFMGAVAQHQYGAMNQVFSTQALYLAEAGFELAIQELMDNADQVFNGAPADGVVGAITNVPVGGGTVTVTKGTETPPVFTATASVGAVRRVVAMTLDVKNLVKNDPVFQDVANLVTNWPETPPAVGSDEGGSGIASNSLKTWTTAGKNQDFTTSREQALDPIVPTDGRVMVRVSYMRDYTGSSSSVNRQSLELHLVRSDGSTQKVWSIGPSSVNATDKAVWFTVDIRGVQTSGSLTTNKVRLVYDLGTSGSASASDQAFGWLDNIAVNVVNKSAWKEQ